MHSRAVGLVVAVLVLVGCGGGGGGARSTDVGTSPTSAGTSTGPGSTSPPAAKASAVIAGKPFTVATQFVQFETTESVWRLHLLGPGHSCKDELASVKPAVGIDFDTGGQDKLPAAGTQTSGIGVVFVPADRPDIGAFTANDGVTLTLATVDAAPKGHWQGHLTVSQVTQGADTYSFDGDINATVCPPGQL